MPPKPKPTEVIVDPTPFAVLLEHEKTHPKHGVYKSEEVPEGWEIRTSPDAEWTESKSNPRQGELVEARPPLAAPISVEFPREMLEAILDPNLPLLYTIKTSGFLAIIEEALGITDGATPND